MKTKIPADKFALNHKRMAEMQSFGMEIEPVDMNEAFVPFDKHAKTNLSNVQDNIQDRFNLENANSDTDEGGEF